MPRRHLLAVVPPFTLAILILLAVATPAAAADLYVSPDGQGQHATIADAVAAAGDGDIIWLAAGVYSGPGNRDVLVDQDLEIRGAGWPERAVIDCGGTPESPHRAFVVEYCDATFFGLTIIGGHHADGGAMTFEEGSATIELCEFRANHADTHGGAIHAWDSAQVHCERTVFARNRAGAGGGAIHAIQDARVTLSRCTLVANGAPNGGHVYLEEYASTVIDRSLLVFACEGAAVSDYYCPDATVTCSDVYGNRAGNWVHTIMGQGGQDGNMSVDPLLADPMGDEPDYRLTVDTPVWVSNDECTRMGAEIFDGYAAAPIYGLEPDGSGMFATIQDAMDGIPAGAVIELTHGSFTGDGNVGLNPQGKALTVRTRANDSNLPARLWMGGEASATTLLTLANDEGPDTVFDDLYLHGAVRGRILQVDGAVGARFIDCRFINGVGNGAAALIQGDPTAPATVSFEGCVLNYNYNRQANGCSGIDASHWQVTMTDVSMRNGDSTSFGPNLRLVNCSGTLLNCAFSGNVNGAALVVEDAPGASLRLLGCDFSANETDGDSDLVATLSGELFLDSCTFAGSTGGAQGGFMNVTGAAGADPVLTLADCQFGATSDASDAGGAMILTGITAALSSCVFTGSEATGQGGAILADGCTLDLFECRFEQTVSGEDGGAVYLRDCDATIAESAFLGCESGRFGGGLFVESGSARLDLGRIIGCAAERGGAIASYSPLEQVRVDVEGMLLANNTVSEFGAAVWCNGADVSIELQQCTIHANEVLGSYDAGQLYATVDATIHAQHCLITGSETTSGAAGVATITAYCCNVWGNADGDWVGPLAGQLGDDENISTDPQYCDPGAGDLEVAASSVCLPDNNACSTLIGALGQGCEGPVGVGDAPAVASATLAPACPNPFNPRTVLSYDLPRPATVELAIFDLRGQRVRTFCRGERREAGRHQVTWLGDDDRGRGLAAGVYLVRLRAEGQADVGRVALVR